WRAMPATTRPRPGQPPRYWRIPAITAGSRPGGLAEAERRQHGEEDAAALGEGMGGHSITSSARASTEGGIVRPRAFAVFMLITSSNLVGCSTGRSAGLAPLRILSTYTAARRRSAGQLVL